MSAAVPRLPPAHTDQVTANRRVAETVNNILGFQHDDSRIRTAAEVAAGVSPVNYAYAPGDLRRYGTNTTPGTTDMTAAIQNALNVAAEGNGGTVILPQGLLKHTGLTISGNGVQLIGASKGAGTAESTVLQYVGSGVGITVNGSYCRLADFSQDNLGTGTVGIQMNGNQILCERVSLTGQNGAVAWSSAAFQSNPTTVAFTHTLRNCYALGHNIGWDVAQGNNMCSDNSFFESNKTNVQVGRVGTVANFSFVNGSVAELFGDLPRGDEIASSISIDIIACNGFVVRDSYFEADGSGTAGSAAQSCVNLRAGAIGGEICGNYMFGGGKSNGAILVADSAVAGVEICGNHFSDFNGYGVMGASGGSPLQCSVHDNGAPSPTSGEYDDTVFVPQLQFGGANVGLTTSTALGRIQRYGKWIIAKVTIQLTALGSSTGSATISGLPTAAAHLNTSGTEDSCGVTVAGLSTVSGGVTAQIKPATPNTINLLSAGSGGAQVALSNSNFGNTSYLNFTLMYQVAA